jgi:hypothetical protein
MQLDLLRAVIFRGNQLFAHGVRLNRNSDDEQAMNASATLRSNSLQ